VTYKKPALATAAGFFMTGFFIVMDKQPELTEMTWRQRIERKLDEAVAALRVIERVEERIVSQAAGLKRAHLRLDDHEIRMRNLEISGAGERNKTSMNEWAIRLTISSVFGMVVGVMVGVAVYLLS
jgi:hypothetical protein